MIIDISLTTRDNIEVTVLDKGNQISSFKVSNDAEGFLTKTRNSVPRIRYANSSAIIFNINVMPCCQIDILYLPHKRRRVQQEFLEIQM